MKEYLKPELDIISLVAEEPITADVDLGDDGVSGEMSTVVNPFG